MRIRPTNKTKAMGLICLFSIPGLWAQAPHAFVEGAQTPNARASQPEGGIPVVPSKDDGSARGEQSGGRHESVKVTNGHLTANVQSRSLNWVLQQISAQGGISIDSKHVERELVTADVRDLPLEEGLRRLLCAQDSFFFYGGVEESPGSGTERSHPSLKAVWVYPKGEGHLASPVPPEQWASTSDLRKSLIASDPQERARAAEILIGRGGQQGLEVTFEALKDRDDQVRYRALDKARNSAVALPMESLQDLVRSDSSPLVRSIALSMAQDSNPEMARVVAESAQSDADLGVKSQAQQVLDELDVADHPPAPDVTQQQPEQGTVQ